MAPGSVLQRRRIAQGEGKAMEHASKHPLLSRGTVDAGCLLFALLTTLLCLYACLVYVGYALLELPKGHEFDWITGALIAPIILAGILVFLGLYLLARVAFRAMDRRISPDTASRAGGRTALRPLMKRYFPKYFLIILCAWMAWVVPHLPGALDADTVWQVLIWRNPQIWYDHHPWLTTMIFGSVFDLGAALGSQSIALAAYSLLQTVIMAGEMAFVLTYIRSFEPPKILLNICLAILCLVPFFPYTASNMCKDSLFCLGWIPFMVILVEGLRTRGQALRRPPWLITFLLVVTFLLLTRKTAPIIIGATLILMVVYAGKAARPYWLASLIAPLAVYAIWVMAVLPAWGVSAGPSKELFSCPLQQTARCVLLESEGSLSPPIGEEARESIEGVLPYEAIPALYDLTTADPIKDNYRYPDSAGLLAYLGTWTSMGLQHPLAYCTATMGTNMQLFLPFKPLALNENIDQAWVDDKVTVFSGYTQDGLDESAVRERIETTREGIAAFDAMAPGRTLLHKYEAALNFTPLRFINSPSFMVFLLPFFMFCFCLGRRHARQKAAFLIALAPLFLLFLSIVVGPMVLARYCMPSAMAAVLILFLPWILGKAGKSGS